MSIDNPIMLDLPAGIETPRLILRPPRAGDGAKVHAAMMDGYDDCVKWVCWDSTPPTVEEVEITCRQQQASWITREFMRFLIIHKDTDEVVGCTAYPPFQLDWRIPFFGISYFISQSQQGNGYATESVAALTHFAFDHLKARKVEIKCDEENPSSQGIPKKLGFELETKQRGNWPSADRKQLSMLLTYARFNTAEMPVKPSDINYL